MYLIDRAHIERAFTENISNGQIDHSFSQLGVHILKIVIEAEK